MDAVVIRGNIVVAERAVIGRGQRDAVVFGADVRVGSVAAERVVVGREQIDTISVVSAPVATGGGVQAGSVAAERVVITGRG